jgi:cold shock protein
MNLEIKMSDDNEIFYGSVVWFSAVKGIGFLAWEKDGVQQKDMFVHYSDIVMEGFKTLYKAQRISFCIGTNARGEPKATSVIVLKN